MEDFVPRPAHIMINNCLYFRIAPHSLFMEMFHGGRMPLKDINELEEEIICRKHRLRIGTDIPKEWKDQDIVIKHVRFFHGITQYNLPQSLGKLGRADNTFIRFIVWSLLNIPGIKIPWGLRQKIVEEYVYGILLQPW